MRADRDRQSRPRHGAQVADLKVTDVMAKAYMRLLVAERRRDRAIHDADQAALLLEAMVGDGQDDQRRIDDQEQWCQALELTARRSADQCAWASAQFDGVLAEAGPPGWTVEMAREAIDDAVMAPLI